jgi:hypothetical protein
MVLSAPVRLAADTSPLVGFRALVFFSVLVRHPIADIPSKTGRNIRQAPCAVAIENDQIVKSRNPTCVPPQ